MHFEPNDQGLILGQNPVTVGHEAAGWVAEAGADVKGFKEGDTVGFIPAYECCYECEPCTKTYISPFSEKLNNQLTNWTRHNAWCIKGCKMQGFAVNGYFQEYVVVDARAAMILPRGLDVKTAAPLFCAGITAFHGVEDCELKPGQWIAIIGCGGLGHLVSVVEY
jgi:propanol-preferring alcohol dehydrogenase